MSSQLLKPFSFLNASAKRVDVTMSWRPKATCVGRRDLAELAEGVVDDHRVRLANECVEQLLRPAAHESGELADVLRLGAIKLRVRQNRSIPWMIISWTLPRPL